MKKHVESYNIAVDGWANLLSKKLLKIEEKVTTKTDLYKDVVSVINDLDKPESHENDYRRIISQLEWDDSKTVKLSQQEFNCYVLDEWSWKSESISSSSKYASSSSSSSRRHIPFNEDS